MEKFNQSLQEQQNLQKDLREFQNIFANTNSHEIIQYMEENKVSLQSLLNNNEADENVIKALKIHLHSMRVLEEVLESQNNS